MNWEVMESGFERESGTVFWKSARRRDCGGWCAFPMWLAPVQARVISVSEKAEAYAREAESVLLAAGLRADADISADKLNAKIRRAQLEKIPYMLVVGERDMAARVVSPRTREGKQLPAMPLDDMAKTLVAEAAVPSLGDAGAKVV